MGDGADHCDDNSTYDVGITCRKCGETGLNWVQGYGGWVLCLEGVIHSCPTTTMSNNKCFYKSTQRGERVSINCVWCGRSFMPRVADVARGWGKFCGKSCKAKQQAALKAAGEVKS